MPVSITVTTPGEISPILLSAAAIESGVGWRWSVAALVSRAVGPLRAAAWSLASNRAYMRAICCAQGPA
jgi:hypothetical protein